MNENERCDILERSKMFFRDKIVKNHEDNTAKLIKLAKFNINPFLVHYLANFLTGNSDAQSLAKVLIYPRVLGTSINTSFGTNMQYFCNTVLKGFASTTSGIDIEFIDQIDGHKKYCQVKAGPDTINKDDVLTILSHFKGVKNLARTNGLNIGIDDLIVGVLYGEKNQLNANYKAIDKEHPVIIGQDFWHRLTGHSDFYLELANAFGEVAVEVDGTGLLRKTIDNLAKEIENSNKL